MQQIIIIGNLGANARIVDVNGSKFITFRVAVTEKRKQGDSTVNETTWYSCTYNRAESAVINYLVTGQQVYIQGKPSYRLYDSAVHKCKMLDVSISVDRLELVGNVKTTEQSNGENPPF